MKTSVMRENILEKLRDVYSLPILLQVVFAAVFTNLAIFQKLRPLSVVYVDYLRGKRQTRSRTEIKRHVENTGE